MKLRVAILGCRGIPNCSGFEHISACIASGLAKRGHEVTVYNQHNHPYTRNSWKDVEIRHCYNPEYFIGRAGRFVYNLNCLLDVRKRKYDIVMLMSYSGNSVWGSLYPRRTAVVTHMGGQKLKQLQYSKSVKIFLKYAEKLAVKYSQYYIADSPMMKAFLQNKYKIDSKYIPCCAELFAKREQFTRAEIVMENYFLPMERVITSPVPAMVIENQFNRETIVDLYEEYLLDCYDHYNFGRAIYY